MIYTKRDHLKRYRGYLENLDIVIDFLEKSNLKDIPQGTTLIKGNDVFVNHFGYRTLPEKDALWEGHTEYADVHVILSGKEKIGISDCSELTEISRDTENDFVGYEGRVQVWCPVNDTKILIVFPEDVHMVKVMDEEASEVDKLVFKIKVK